MAQPDHIFMASRGTLDTRAIQNQPTNVASLMASEEDLLADVDEPPDLQRTPRPSAIVSQGSFKTPFTKATPPPTERKASLLTSALHSDGITMVHEEHRSASISRGMSCVSTWSNNSATTAELTSDGGLTSPATPSPPLPKSVFDTMVPIFNKKPFEQPLSVVHHDEDSIGPLQKPEPAKSGEQGVEVSLGRKRCISFACGRKSEPQASPEPAQPTTKPEPAPEAPKRACAISFACGPRPQTQASPEPAKPKAVPEPITEPSKRVCTISFACPSKSPADASSQVGKLRSGRAVSPAPLLHRQRASSKASVKHRDSDATVRSMSPMSVRKAPVTKDRCRRLSGNSDLARTEAFRFHEFASSEEEIEDWTLESTCHRSRLTVSDTLRVENSLRQLAEEAEEEAMDEDEDDDEDVDDGDSDDDMLDDDNEEEEEEVEDDMSDEGFQTDDEEGFAVSDDESDAGSDFNWWAPGAAYSTAATSVELLEQIRPSARRSISESSDGSAHSDAGFKMSKKPLKRRKSRPVNIRAPSPELPDSTDFVCGTLDEDRPLEDAYLTCLERRRAAKHKITPQDIDPTFPTSDPEMDEEDDDDDDEQDNPASESDQHVMMHGQMDQLDGDYRGRGKGSSTKRSPPPSPRRMRSPPPTKRTVYRSPPPTKRTLHRSPPPTKRTGNKSPPPRKLFGNSPRRARSPAPGAPTRSPPPTRRESEIMSPQREAFNARFSGLAQRPALTVSSSVPRTPLATLPLEDMEGEDTCRELPARGAINIKVGLEKKRQRRKEQLYRKTHRKGVKEKRPAPGKGCERMREMGIGLAAYRGKTTGFGFGFGMPPTPDQKDMLVLSL